MFECFNELGRVQQKFLFSCMSEGVIPKGLRINFQLAKFVNDENFVSSLQNLLEDSNSRILEMLYEKISSKEEEIISRVEALRDEAINVIGEQEGQLLFNQMRTGNGLVVQKENKKFATKLTKLKNQKQSAVNTGFRVSGGSRRMNTKEM